ncbi:hypothetical protein M8J75_016236 [Diaphorina citri]|nr:hypothetical protein M8J75_016236 [Diaphorina citri]
MGVCLVCQSVAEIQQVHFKTKNIKDAKTGFVQEKNNLQDTTDGNEKMQSRDSGYLLSGGVSALGALLFLKVKAVLFVIAVILIIGLLTKVVGGYGLMCGIGGPCDGIAGGFASSGQASTGPFHPAYKEADSYFPNYNPSAGSGDEYYRRAMNTFDLGFLAKLMKSVDFVDMTFNVLNLEEEECRKKLVCEMDNTSAQNPIMKYLMESFKVNLEKYRPVHNLNATLKQDCDFLYPECKRSLSPVNLNLLNF